MSSHAKSSIVTMTGAIMLILTVIIRHTSDDSATKPWTDTYLPILAFLLIAIGMYFSVKARNEPKG